jgi:class 3 adenylate cyclase/tetratricopeptide (TPR) repeat protein
MRCSKCSVENADDRRFCIECGALLPIACPACGSENPPQAKFCGSCGVRLTRAEAKTPQQEKPAGADKSHPSELRLVTVVFADLCNFSRHSGDLGPEGTHELLGRFFEVVDDVVEQYGGTIDKHVGDNVMAVFGAPIAHGNDPERAIRAASDIHAAMVRLSDELARSLRVHIGIASGQVMASQSGSSRHEEYTVIGDAVNLAARLCDLAGHGETLISDAVYRAGSHLVEADAAGDVAVEGFDRPMRIWRMRAPRSDAFGAVETPFVGRRVELGQFAGIVDACCAAGNGQAILIRGEAGIGKTRLVGELQSLARERGFACHTGLVLDFGVGKGQDAVRALVRSLLDLPSDSRKDARQAAADRALAGGLLRAEQRVFLNDLLDLPQPLDMRALYDAMDNDTRNRGKQTVVSLLINAFSARQPVLLTMEDIHWADRPTLAHLTAMTATVRDRPALLVMTTRIEGDPLDHARRAAIQGNPLITVDLGPLRRTEAVTLAGALIDPNDPRTSECIERADGNPLFLEQLLRNAAESGDRSVPASIQSLVLARIDRLSRADKEAVQAASVIGQRFSLDTLRHLLDDPAYVSTGLVEHYLVRPELEYYLFVHALIQEAVYSSLIKARKRDLHRRAAQWFATRDPVPHAQHLDRADDPAAPRAYLEAARQQAASFHYERALRLTERGLALARDRADKFDLTCQRGELLHDLGSIAESIATYRSALETTSDAAACCRAWIGLAAGMRVSDEYEEALAALERAEAAATAHTLTAELARIHHLRGNLFFPLGRIDGVREQHELALKYAQAAHSAEAEARALGGLGDAEYARGRMISAYNYFSRCLELCRTHGFGRIEVANLYMIAATRSYFDGPALALGDALAAIDAAVRVGHQRAEMVARALTQRILIDLDDLAAARDQMERTEPLIRRLNARRFEVWNLMTLARIQQTAGDQRDAVETLEQAMAICRGTGTGFKGPEVLAKMAILTDEALARRRLLAEAEAILRDGAVGHSHISFYGDAIDAALLRDEWDEAERYCAALEDYVRLEPLPRADLTVGRGRVLAAFGRGRRDEATMAELRRVRNEAERFGLRTALPALDRALAA